MRKKSSTRSKTHPYLNIRNWIGDGQCVFWNDGMHNPDLYEPTIAEAVSKERGVVMFQDNIPKTQQR